MAAGEQMYLVELGAGKRATYGWAMYPTSRIKWVSPETDAQREPVEVTTTCKVSGPFCAAGMQYRNLHCFLKSQDGVWGEDVHGRSVFCTWERFPCFDEFDAQYENRFYRWFLIRNGDSLTRIFYADGADVLYITEDVQNLELRVLSSMAREGFCLLPPK